jgi:translation initiation factor 2 beta subunit (eIF-2beta)/eIF-5
MADEDKNNLSIFSGVNSAINKNKRKTPVVQNPGVVQGVGDGLRNRQNQGNNIEHVQQQFLDWQVNKIANDLYTRTIYYDTDRIAAYNDFRAMDMSPEIAAALNIIRDECITRGEKGKILDIFSENSRVKTVLEDLFYNRLDIDFALKLWIRDLLKYGDFFLQLQIDKSEGIYGVMALPSDEMHREEGFEGRTDDVRFRWETTGDIFEDWQMAHFRLLEDVRKLPYGRSILDPARKLWKQLQLAEDSMLVYRITRAPERRVFYIDVGNLEHADVSQFIQQFQIQLKKQPIVDQRTGNINTKYNPMNVTEDYFIPMRADRSSRIETLPGASNLGDIQDIEYLQNKLFASLQVPKNYLNYGESLPGGSTLSQQDLRFARTINTIQQAILAELKRVANIHLYFNGFKDDIDNFTLTLNNPSTQQELLKLETMKARLEVFKEMFSAEATSPVSYVWAMENILGFSKNEIKLILKQKKVEKKIFAEIDSAVEMYKKIGLFKDLDDKFEIEGAEEMMKAQQAGEGGGDEGGGDLGGGGGGGGGFGGGGFGGAEELDLGADAGAGAEAGADAGAEAAPEATPVAESKFRKAQKLSDNHVDNMLNELLGVEETSKPKIEDNALIRRSNSMKNESQKLIKSINNGLANRGVREMIQEEYSILPTPISNPLVDGSEKLGKDNDQLMDEIEKFLRNRKR